MKKVGLTQRVELEPRFGERRDCLDQRWFGLFQRLGWLPVPLPNLPPEQAADFLTSVGVQGLVLTGGNSLAHLEPGAGCAPERDAWEAALLDWASSEGVACLGVCRGLQMINHYFGGTTVRGEGHVAKRHLISPTIAGERWLAERMVNSYHDWLVEPSQLADSLDVIALAQDGTVEAAIHRTLPILGVMWHPEREDPFQAEDVEMLRNFVDD